jgi:biotin operon repressor
MGLKHAARRLLKLLESRAGNWVSGVEMQALGIRNYRPRITELRQAGYQIENRREYVGKRRDSCYRLVGKEPETIRLLADAKERNGHADGAANESRRAEALVGDGAGPAAGARPADPRAA